MSLTLNKGVNKHSFDSGEPTLEDYVFDTSSDFPYPENNSLTTQASQGVTVWSSELVNVYGYDPSQNPNGFDEMANPPNVDGWILIGTTSASNKSINIPAGQYTKGIAIPVSGVADVSLTPMLKAASVFNLSSNKTVDTFSDVPPFTEHDVKKVLMVNEEGKLEWTSIRPL